MTEEALPGPRMGKGLAESFGQAIATASRAALKDYATRKVSSDVYTVRQVSVLTN